MPAVIKECRHGHMMFNPDDTFIGGSLDKYGEFSEQEVQGLLSLLPERGIALDIGANIGCLTVPLAKKAAFVIAIEPQRITFQHLCANLCLAGLRNVEASRAAMGSAPGIVRIVQPDWDKPGNNGGYALTESEQGEGTRVITIDGMGLNRCDLIKIDVEGMEGEVIAGGLETIRRLKPALYVEADRDAKTPALVDQIMDLGYQCWWHLPPLYSPTNFNKNPDDAFPGIVSINLLCLADRNPPDLQLYEAVRGDSFPRLITRLAG